MVMCSNEVKDNQARDLYSAYPRGALVTWCSGQLTVMDNIYTVYLHV